MNLKFRRHQKVILLRNPLEEDIEPYDEDEDNDNTAIKKGMMGEINIVLPNGRYHVRVFDKNGKIIAYVAMDEDGLGEIE